MFASGVITFRETLEAALVIGIILSFLTKTNQISFKKHVWHGMFVGGGAALILALVLNIFFGGLPEGKVEQTFEGILMFVTASLLTGMILWVHRQKEVAAQIRSQVSKHIATKYGWGIMILAATSVLREGTETVLYLKATSMTGVHNEQFIGALIGLLLAIAIGTAMFRFARRIKLAIIFRVTTFLLLLFAAGLVSHGVHEFQEAGYLPIFFFDPVFNISKFLSDESVFGSILHSLFGYSSSPTSLQIVSYGSYLVFIWWLERFTDRIIQRKTFVHVR